MRDGHTYSLPSMVKLTVVPTPLAFRQVVAYCGTAWGRTGTGLYRLEKDGLARFAQWESVPLPSRRPGPTNRLEEGYLHVAGDSLFVVDTVGNIVRITEPGCPAMTTP